MGQAGLERLLQVQEKRAGSNHTGLGIVKAKACQRGDAEVIQERGPRRGRVKSPIRPLRHGHGRSPLAQPLQEPAGIPFAAQAFRRRQPAQLIGQALPGSIGGLKLAGRELDPG